MPKASRDALGAKGKTDVYYLDPDEVVLVTDKKSALYDERVENSYNEELVLNMLYAPDGETAQGVLEPTIGRRNPETGKVEIIDGRQRTLACREANKRQKKSTRTESRKGKRGGSVGGAPRECGVCHKLGHNRRSHLPGGKLFKGR